MPLTRSRPCTFPGRKVAPGERLREDPPTVFPRRVSTRPDVMDVLEISALLAVSEFRVFEIAHVRWYGVAAEESTIERHFIPYMFREQVPAYVRAFTREVKATEKAGRLDPEALGIEREQSTTRDLVKGLFYSLFAVASLTVLVLLAKVTAERLGFAGCMFPPCF
jgi:hypothetical protein